jgi:hypothetical protein
MTWLASLPAGVLFAVGTALALGVGFASRVATRALVPIGEHDHVQSIAGPLMPALGATFAVLMALTLASEAGYLRSAQDIVSNEAAQASRLAWAATNPEVEAGPIQAALADYLRATRTHEWRGSDIGESEGTDTGRAIGNLERVVRAAAARPRVSNPTSTELLAALDALTIARRDRLAASSRELPVLYVLTLVASGVALIANAGALTFRSSVRTSLLVVGLAVVVAFSLALLFALSAPFDGPLIVSGRPIDTILRDLSAGFFRG